MQALTQRLALGTELTVQRDRQGRIGSGLTFAGRYVGDEFMFTANASTNGSILATYIQRVRAPAPPPSRARISVACACARAARRSDRIPRHRSRSHGAGII